MSIASAGPNAWLYTLSSLRALLPLSSLGLGLADVPLALDAPLPALVGLGSVAIYALLFFVIWPYIFASARVAVAAGKPRQEPSWALTHHAVLCVYSLICCSALGYHLLTTGEASSWHAFACTPLPPVLRLLSATFTISKIVEWGDTAVLFARGSTRTGVGFLHAYHHATTFLLFLIVMNLPSTEKSGLFFNGFVHTLMYAHFAWRLPRWARPLITAAQIVQLFAVTIVWAVTPGECSAYAHYPRAHPITFAVPFALVPVYLIAFLRFFAATYCGGGGKGGKAPKAE